MFSFVDEKSTNVIDLTDDVPKTPSSPMQGVPCFPTWHRRT